MQFKLKQILLQPEPDHRFQFPPCHEAQGLPCLSDRPPATAGTLREGLPAPAVGASRFTASHLHGQRSFTVLLSAVLKREKKRQENM